MVLSNPPREEVANHIVLELEFWGYFELATSFKSYDSSRREFSRVREECWE